MRDIESGNAVVPGDIVTDRDPEFATRESPLTILLEHSLHIRAVYHIFVVILLLLLCDTALADLLENGKINIGITSVAKGFLYIGPSTLLWLLQLAVVTAFFPGLRLYAAGRKTIEKKPVLRKIWSYVGFVGVVALEVTLITMTVLLVPRHSPASTMVVTSEMFRFVTKIWTVAVACSPRCHDRSRPLPSFSHFIYFLFAPTLLYRDHYPRTKSIRWCKVIFHFLEVVAIVFYYSLLFERFILPYWSDYGKEPQVEAGSVVRAMFASVLPGVISFLCLFYCLLHAWLNAFAELLKFGDRLFYQEWWTASQFSRYYREWNRPVHLWLRDHIYIPLVPSVGRACSTIAVFTLSAAAHEVVLALSFGFFYPVLLVLFNVVGMLMMPLTSTAGRLFPRTFNLIMWLFFFFGNGLLWSLYPMEYYARKNCPASEGDSFFVPKSWSCPEIVLKSDWKFQNPFN